jgi:hypothetical protein
LPLSPIVDSSIKHSTFVPTVEHADSILRSDGKSKNPNAVSTQNILRNLDNSGGDSRRSRSFRCAFVASSSYDSFVAATSTDEKPRYFGPYIFRCLHYM